MKSTALPFRFVLPVLAMLSIPFIYNSCQSSMSAKTYASQTASCKVGLENGVATKMQFDDGAAPGAFAAKKVRLKNDLDPAGAQAKASGPLLIEAGQSLGVIIDNACLQQSKATLGNTVISKAAADSHSLLPELDRQAYEWILDRAYTDTEIEDLADQEACVVGLTWNKTYTMQAAFNDPQQGNQTHLAAMRAQESYDLFYNAAGGMETTGAPVIVAVVDTGVDWQHPDLLANMWSHADGIGIDITTLGGATPVDYNPYDVSGIGHGTHVAGIIAAASNNGVGITGVMPYRAKIMAIKVFKVGTGGALSTTSQYFYNAVKFAYLNGASVINLSLGAVGAGASTDSLAEAGVTEAVQHGVFVTTVIGNSSGGSAGQLINGTTYSSLPGQYSTLSGVVGVGSIDVNTGMKSSFSHFSPTFAEIGAPGATQGSTGIFSTVTRALGSYARLAGTSQAAPMVSAAAALTIGLIRKSYGAPPTPTEVERLLLASATKNSGLTTYFKDGNTLNLLALAQKINADYPLTQAGGSPANPTTLPGCN